MATVGRTVMFSGDKSCLLPRSSVGNVLTLIYRFSITILYKWMKQYGFNFRDCFEEDIIEFTDSKIDCNICKTYFI
jgi:hypothetical protein